MQIRRFRGSRTVMSFRLCSRAPWTTSSSAAIRGGHCIGRTYVRPVVGTVPHPSPLLPGMRFRPGAGLDSSQVQDRRGMGGVAVGGGGLGLAGLVVYLLFNALTGGSAGLSDALQHLD